MLETGKFGERKLLSRLIFSFLIVSVLFTMAFALLQTVTSFEVTLDPLQLLILGAVASVLIQGFKWVAEIADTEIDARYVRIVVFLVSLGMGYYWIRPEMPTGSDPMDWFLALLTGLSVIGGMSKVIYDVLLERLLKGLDIVLQFRRFKFEPKSRPKPVG
jgi:hypothetical protein